MYINNNFKTFELTKVKHFLTCSLVLKVDIKKLTHKKRFSFYFKHSVRNFLNEIERVYLKIIN